MAAEKTMSEQEWHKKSAVDLFNLTWDFLDKEERAVEEDDKMVHAAHASRFHWGEIGELLQFERGEWQISRVYAALNRPQAALYHAERCLAICTANDIADFDIAYEAMARVYAVAGEAARSQEYVGLAERAAQEIEDEGTRDYFLSELRTIADLLQ